MARDIQRIRNIGIIAHIDAGKTTVTEHMLFYSGAKHRVGEVDSGTTETDCDAEEQERGITIYSACVTFDWLDVHINLLDTPGHVDFTAEVERCLRVLDGAVVVFSAREGVEAQSETVWRQADRYQVPRLAFINKMDREGADFERTFDEIAHRLGAHPVALQIPVGLGPAHMNDPFRGVIDLIEMKMLVFDQETEGRIVQRVDIPPDKLDAAEWWRDAMLEKLYMHSDALMELALQEEPLPVELIRQAIRQATVHLQIQPVLCGSALHGVGVQPILDAVAWYLPSPLEVPPVEGTNPAKKDKVEHRKPELDEPFCGLVFKVLPAKTGDLSWVRIYSGELKSNTRALIPGKDKKENVAQLWRIHATKREQQVERALAGDIVGLIGLRHAITGDTLCDTRHPILLESIKFPETVISMAIEPDSATEREKLSDTLEMLKRQDPTLKVTSGETGQTLISGMGELHLEVIKNRLLRDFNLKVKFHKPQVSYRETVQHAVEVTGVCHRQIAGQQLFAELRIRMEPFAAALQPVTVLNFCPPETLPEACLTAAVEELKACGEGGGRIAGYPLMKLKVSILGGKASAEHSNEMAFRIASNDAFDKALEQGGPVLLEPIMKLDILTPEAYLGDFVGDLQQRRAIIAKTEHRGSMTVIEAHAPLKELFGYSSAMRSLSQGAPVARSSPWPTPPPHPARSRNTRAKDPSLCRPLPAANRSVRPAGKALAGPFQQIGHGQMLRAAFFARPATVAGRRAFGFGQAQVQIPAQQLGAAFVDRGLIVEFEVQRDVHAAGAGQAIAALGTRNGREPLVLVADSCQQLQCVCRQRAHSRPPGAGNVLADLFQRAHAAEHQRHLRLVPQPAHAPGRRVGGPPRPSPRSAGPQAEDWPACRRTAVP